MMKLKSVLVAVLFLVACSDPSAVTTTAAPTTSVAPDPTSTTQPGSTTTTFALIARTPHDRCLDRAVFGDPGESPFVLPFPAGQGYTILQSYCNDDGSHEDQLAYDFAMPIGTEVTAARGGFVTAVISDVPDEANTSLLNYIRIKHDDDTVAFYAHLQENGVLVEVGETVFTGDLIGFSGSSGRTGEILHFGVYGTSPPRDATDHAINFSNAEGPLDARNGLRQGTFYRALP